MSFSDLRGEVTRMTEGYYRKNAIITGVLFIIATGVDILSISFLGPINATNYLVDVSANGGLVAAGALLLFIGGAAATGIAISLYPVLRKYNGGLALGAVGFRTIEGVLRFVAVCGLLLLITLSHQFVEAGAPDSSYFQTLGALLLAGYRWVANVGALLAFSIGCMLYYIIFYRTKLVPRWLSGWGLVAAILTMLSCVLTMFGAIDPFSTEQIILNLPILPQEMVLAAWLIVKGFNPSAIASGEHS
ncbi:MAG: DUF4386 domain-containing protein [Methanomassiliicoccales archaeon]|nr:DUF4386 domain-containing protein [Methanomassiliicoccales archaeon]